MTLRQQKTKIVATIGPASSSRQVMGEMIEAGMDLARLNLSHGDFEGHHQTIANLNAAARSAGRRLTIMADLPGPKIRIGRLAAEPVQLKAGDFFTLTTEEITGDASRASVTFSRLPATVKPGDRLFLNDGFIQLEVVSTIGPEVKCCVLVGGELRSRKGLNLPGIDLGIGAFTETDRKCLEFALGEGINVISQSFVESAHDVASVRAAAAELGKNPFIIAKIERSRALERIDEILDAADGIMIARGDLGVEIPIEQIAVQQKLLMRKATMLGKPVITATQMLESMVSNRRPTRAEATDVANAILDGTDCVMLSEESAMGTYPVDAVGMLGKIARAIEPHRPAQYVREALQSIDAGGRLTDGDLIALSVERALGRLDLAAVVVPSRSGVTVRRLSRLRLPVWIIAVSANEATLEGLHLSYGVHPLYQAEDPDNWSAWAKEWVMDEGLPGTKIILIEGPSPRNPAANHRMEFIGLSG
jgi:pyruvate kinase